MLSCVQSTLNATQYMVDFFWFEPHLGRRLPLPSAQPNAQEALDLWVRPPPLPVFLELFYAAFRDWHLGSRPRINYIGLCSYFEPNLGGGLTCTDATLALL